MAVISNGSTKKVTMTMSNFDEVDKQVKSIMKFSVGLIIAFVLAAFAMAGLWIWVVVKLLQHFEVI